MKKALRVFLILVILNIVITSLIDRIKHSYYTETELMIRLPRVFLYKF